MTEETLLDTCSLPRNSPGSHHFVDGSEDNPPCIQVQLVGVDEPTLTLCQQLCCEVPISFESLFPFHNDRDETLQGRKAIRQLSETSSEQDEALLQQQMLADLGFAVDAAPSEQRVSWDQGLMNRQQSYPDSSGQNAPSSSQDEDVAVVCQKPNIEVKLISNAEITEGKQSDLYSDFVQSEVKNQEVLQFGSGASNESAEQVTPKSFGPIESQCGSEPAQVVVPLPQTIPSDAPISKMCSDISLPPQPKAQQTYEEYSQVESSEPENQAKNSQNSEEYGDEYRDDVHFDADPFEEPVVIPTDNESTPDEENYSSPHTPSNRPNSQPVSVPPPVKQRIVDSSHGQKPTSVVVTNPISKNSTHRSVSEVPPDSVPLSVHEVKELPQEAAIGNVQIQMFEPKVVADSDRQSNSHESTVRKLKVNNSYGFLDRRIDRPIGPNPKLGESPDPRYQIIKTEHSKTVMQKRSSFTQVEKIRKLQPERSKQVFRLHYGSLPKLKQNLMTTNSGVRISRQVMPSGPPAAQSHRSIQTRVNKFYLSKLSKRSLNTLQNSAHKSSSISPDLVRPDSLTALNPYDIPNVDILNFSQQKLKRITLPKKPLWDSSMQVSSWAQQMQRYELPVGAKDIIQRQMELNKTVFQQNEQTHLRNLKQIQNEFNRQSFDDLNQSPQQKPQKGYQTDFRGRGFSRLSADHVLQSFQGKSQKQLKEENEYGLSVPQEERKFLTNQMGFFPKIPQHKQNSRQSSEYNF